MTLSAALDGLAADELHGLTDSALLARTRALVAARNRIDAELTRTTRIGDAAGAPQHDGLRSMRSWLRGHGRLTPSAARALAVRGRGLGHLPVLAAAFASGDVTADQVDLVAPVTAPRYLALADEQGVDLSEIDAALTVIACGHPVRELAAAVHDHLAMLDTDGPEPDPTEERELSISARPDGSSRGRWELDQIGTEKVRTALESVLRATRPAGDTRTRAQQLADALVQLADIHLGCGTLPMTRGVKPHVALQVDAEDLLDGDDADRTVVATAQFGARLSAVRARWLACDADLTRIVLGADSVPLDVGRAHRLITRAIRRAVEVRDQHCVFAGCDAPVHWCEVHHLVPWWLGGETSLGNSGLLCERHHTQVHHGFRIHRDAEGFWHTYRPDGSEIVVGARPWPDGGPGTGPPGVGADAVAELVST